MNSIELKTAYKELDNEALFTCLVNTLNRLNYKRFDPTNTEEKVKLAINTVIVIFSERNIIFKKLEFGKKWVACDLDYKKELIKLYGEENKKTGFESIGTY